MIHGFITAFRTLTILPVPGHDAKRLASALPWFPVVGLLLGGVYYLIAMIPQWSEARGWPEGIAAVIVAASVVLTRGLHLDGLADTADGFGCRGDRDKTLAVMKDPHSGAFGVIAIVVAILIRFVAVADLAADGAAVMLIVAAVVSRTMQVELMTVLPYARTEGGTAAPFVHGAHLWHRIAALCTGTVCAGCMGGLAAGVGAMLLGLLVCRLFGCWCKKSIGGITGDCLGACSEMVETSVLFLAAMLWGRNVGSPWWTGIPG